MMIFTYFVFIQYYTTLKKLNMVECIPVSVQLTFPKAHFPKTTNFSLKPSVYTEGTNGQIAPGTEITF